VLLICFVSVLCFFVESCSMLFCFAGFRVYRVLRVFGVGLFLLLVRLLARFHCVVYAGIGLSSMPFFVLKCMLLARELSPRLALCDVFCCLRLC